MDNLALDLHSICKHNRDGSHATQANRATMLRAICRDLRKGGYRLPGARSLKPKHVEFLVGRWQRQGISSATIKNRMSALRWAAAKVDKASIIPRENSALGIPDRERSQDNKAQKLDWAKLERIDSPHMRMSLRLMAAFGLRFEEALKIRPALADKGDHIALQASWTKGGRARVIPIHSGKHRALLDEAKALTGRGSLIPDDHSYIQHRRAMEYATLRAGFSNLHGLRHNYAQWRYKTLTGHACPKAGGILSAGMTAFEKEQDQTARLTISRELGHNRIEITREYLG